MKTIPICKADSTTADNPIESVALVLDETIPKDLIAGDEWEQRCRLFYERQGKLLADALFDHLPGGTIDALLYEMLRRRSTLFRVPLFRDRKR